MPSSIKEKVASAASAADRKDEVIDRLENALEREKDRRLEERFFWVFAILLILDCFWILPSMPNWGAAIAVLVLQLVFLAVYARYCGIDDISVLIDKAVDGYKSRGGKGNEDP